MWKFKFRGMQTAPVPVSFCLRSFKQNHAQHQHYVDMTH